VVVVVVVCGFSIFDSRFSIGRFRAECEMERQIPIEDRESRIESN
jgi:hypothetical protein